MPNLLEQYEQYPNSTNSTRTVRTLNHEFNFRCRDICHRYFIKIWEQRDITIREGSEVNGPEK